MTGPQAALLLVWLVVAHLVADFVLQTEAMVADKNGHGRRAVRGLAAHAAGVAVCLAPVVAALGGPGLAAAAVVVASHVLIDRVKVLLTRRAEAAALAGAHQRHAPADGPVLGMNAAWTPIPGALFVLDQLAHLGILVAVWAAWLASAPLLDSWRAAIDVLVGSWGAAGVHRAAVVGAVGLALAIVNVRAASLFVATLVNPRSAVAHAGHLGGEAQPARPASPAASSASPAASPAASSDDAQAAGWRLRLGPLELRGGPPRAATETAERGAAVAARTPPPDVGAGASGIAPPARIGEAIGVLERLLIVVLVLSAAEAAIGLVIAAKTLARFRQLDDRAFAEYYLLGTLASVSVALVSALLGQVALAI